MPSRSRSVNAEPTSLGSESLFSRGAESGFILAPAAPDADVRIDLFTIEQVAQMLGVTRRGLRKIVSSNGLPRPFKVGRRRYWRRETLATFLGRREAQANGSYAGRAHV